MSPSHQRIKKPWAVATRQPVAKSHTPRPTSSPESATETPPLPIFFYSTEQKEFLLTATPVKEEIERERGRGGNTASSVAWTRLALLLPRPRGPTRENRPSSAGRLLSSLLCLLSLSSPTAAAVAASTLRFLPLPLPHSLTHPSSITLAVRAAGARGLEISRFAPEIRVVDPPAAASSSGGWARRRRSIRLLPRRIGGRCQRAGWSGSVVASMIRSDRRRRRRR